MKSFTKYLIETAQTLKLYHGSHSELFELVPREVKGVDSLGTWLTSSIDNALGYAKHAYEAEIQGTLKLKKMASNSFNLSFSPKTVDQIKWLELHGYREEAKILKNVPITPEAETRLKELSKKFDRNRSEEKELNALRDAKEAMRSLMGYGSKSFGMGWKDKAEWMKAWRKLLEDDGYDGVVWKDSTIDFGKSSKHDVYCLFNKNSIKLKKVATGLD